MLTPGMIRGPSRRPLHPPPPAPPEPPTPRPPADAAASGDRLVDRVRHPAREVRRLLSDALLDVRGQGRHAQPQLLALVRREHGTAAAAAHHPQPPPLTL